MLKNSARIRQTAAPIPGISASYLSSRAAFFITRGFIDINCLSSKDGGLADKNGKGRSATTPQELFSLWLSIRAATAVEL